MLRIKTVEKLIVALYLKFPYFYEYIINKKYGKLKELTLEIHGVKILFSTEDIRSRIWLYNKCSNGKIHEEKVINMLVEKITFSKCFVDVGAHLGYYTCVASKFMPKGIIYGFEMDELNYLLAEKNLKLNECKNAHIYHAAVANSSGIVKYLIKKGQPSNTFSISKNALKEENDHIINVKSIALDDFFKDKEITPDVIKIDVEGAEMEVLKGMMNLIKNNDIKLFIEVHPMKLLDNNSSASAVISMLLDLDYTIFEIENFRESSKDPYLKKLDRNSYPQKDFMLFAQR